MTFCMILYCNSENLSLLGVARQFLQMFSKFAQILQTFWTGKLANNYEFLEFESLYCRMSFLVWIEKFEVWDIFISFTRTSWYSEKKDKILNLSSLVIFLLRKIKTSFLISFAHEKRNIYQKNIKPFMSKFDQKCLIFTSIKALKSDHVSTSPIWFKLSDISLLVVNPYVKHYFRSSQLHYIL